MVHRRTQQDMGPERGLAQDPASFLSFPWGSRASAAATRMLSLHLNTPYVLKQATGDLYQITLLPFPHEITNRNRGFSGRAHDVQEPLARLGIFS